jgi:putative oxidoreductase
MSDEVLNASAHPVSGRIVHGLRTRVRGLGRLAVCVAPPVLRVALAVPFYRSGLTKWDGFLSLAPTAQYLFEEEFHLHLLGHTYGFPFPDVLAYFDGVGEIVLPVLLLVGLATRLSALGILIMVGVIQLTVPSAWATFHLPWAALALGIMALGPGPVSLDRLIERWFVPRFAATPV